MSSEARELAEIHPPEKSMSGRNSHYFFCEHRQQQVSYAVCLHTILAIDENRLPSKSFVDCQRGYCHNTCYAKKMRAEEKSVGQALYYKPRIEVKAIIATDKDSGAQSSGKYDMNNASYARGWAIGGGQGEVRERKKAVTRPAAPPKPKDHFVTATAADLVNAVMADEKKEAPKPAPKPAAQPAAASTQLRPMPGESTADFIKRRAQLMKAGK